MEGAVDVVKQYAKRSANYLAEQGKKFMATSTPFKKKHPFYMRLAESERIIKQYPDRIPVICEPMGDDTPKIDRTKFLIPEEFTMAHLMYVIRRKVGLKTDQSLFMFVNNKSMVGCQNVRFVYSLEKDEDGFLYTSYSRENTFGA